jgi:hypothetical protein
MSRALRVSTRWSRTPASTHGPGRVAPSWGRNTSPSAGQARARRGPGALRHALYLAACVAARCAPEWHERYERLLNRGLAKKEAFTILARALLRVIYHLLRTAAHCCALLRTAAHCCAPVRPMMPTNSSRRQRCRRLDIQYELFLVKPTLSSPFLAGANDPSRKAMV